MPIPPSPPSVVVKDAGTLVGTRRGLNFIDGVGVTIGVVDNPATNAVDVTVQAIGGVGGGSIYAATVTVSPSGGDFSSIQAAITACTGADDNTRFLVLVYPGIYAEQITMAPFVDVIGADREAVVILYASTSGAVIMAANSKLENVTLPRNGASGDWYIKGTNADKCVLRHVNIGRVPHQEYTTIGGGLGYTGGITLINSDNVLLEGLHVDVDVLTAGFGILLDNCDSVLFDRCRIRTLIGDGGGGGGVVGLSAATNIDFINCFLRNGSNDKPTLNVMGGGGRLINSTLLGWTTATAVYIASSGGNVDIMNSHVDSVQNDGAGAIEGPAYGALVRNNNQVVTTGGADTVASGWTSIERNDAVSGSPFLAYSVVNPSRLTAQAGGWYLVGVNVAWQPTSTVGARYVNTRIDGTTYFMSYRDMATTDAAVRIGGAMPIHLRKGQYVECLLFQNSGVSIACNVDFSLVRLAA